MWREIVVCAVFCIIFMENVLFFICNFKLFLLPLHLKTTKTRL